MYDRAISLDASAKMYALVIYGRHAWCMDAFERKGCRLGGHGGGFRADRQAKTGTVGLTHGTRAPPFRCVSLAVALCCSGRTST